jgi:hypothetical protein
VFGQDLETFKSLNFHADESIALIFFVSEPREILLTPVRAIFLTFFNVMFPDASRIALFLLRRTAFLRLLISKLSSNIFLKPISIAFCS